VVRDFSSDKLTVTSTGGRRFAVFFLPQPKQTVRPASSDSTTIIRESDVNVPRRNGQLLSWRNFVPAKGGGSDAACIAHVHAYALRSRQDRKGQVPAGFARPDTSGLVCRCQRNDGRRLRAKSGST
jgi:hypothetical protein